MILSCYFLNFNNINRHNFGSDLKFLLDIGLPQQYSICRVIPTFDGKESYWLLFANQCRSVYRCHWGVLVEEKLSLTATTLRRML